MYRDSPPFRSAFILFALLVGFTCVLQRPRVAASVARGAKATLSVGIFPSFSWTSNTPGRYVEIYNNIFHNLLDDVGGVTPGGEADDARGRHRLKSPGTDAAPPLPPPPSKIEVREHPSRGVFLSGGKGLRVPVSSATAVATLVARGTKARRTAATGLNDRSSRSHAILILEIEATHNSPVAPTTGTSAAAVPASRSGTRLRDGLQGSRISRRASITEFVSIGKMQVRVMGEKKLVVKGRGWKGGTRSSSSIFPPRG